MAKYIVQHRRGSSAQWAEKNTIIPMEGEIVIEIDEEHGLHKLKIGDGIHTYADLAYLTAGDDVVTQVLAKALPRVITVTLDVDQWTEVTSETDPHLGYYGQTVSIDNITTYSRLDLQPNADMLAEFQALNLVFVTENHNGVMTVYSVGDVPLRSYTMQATIVETDGVADSEKIIGIPVGTPTAKSDWNQTDETQADYIRNKPEIPSIDGLASETYVDAKPGIKTTQGGEIFNDYENNIAGAMCYNIISISKLKDAVTLDSVEGLEIGDEISLVLNANYDFYRTIQEISGNTIKLNEALPTEWGTGPSSDTATKNKLWVPAKPYLGTTALASYAHAKGVNNIACNEGSYAEGGYNITSGKYGHTEGRRNKAGFAAHAQNEDNQAIANFSSAGGKGNIATVTAQDVIGTYNKINHDAIAIIGNGESDTARNNAFEVLKDGSATVDKQGLSANSVVRKDYLDSQYKTVGIATIDVCKENVLSGTFGDSPITSLQVTPTSATSGNKIVISDSYNLIKLDLSKFTSNKQDGNSNSYKAIIKDGLELYYKNNKLYLNGKSTAADYSIFYGIGVAELVKGTRYTASIYDKKDNNNGIGTTSSTTNVFNVGRNAVADTGICSASATIDQNMTYVVNLVVTKGIQYNDREVRFALTAGGSPRDFAPFSSYQALSLPNTYSTTTPIENHNLVMYQDTTYIYSSIPCSFGHWYNRYAKTETQISDLNDRVNLLDSTGLETQTQLSALTETVSALSSTGLKREIVTAVPTPSEAKENVIYMVGPRSDSDQRQLLLRYDWPVETDMELNEEGKTYYTIPLVSCRIGDTPDELVLRLSGSDATEYHWYFDGSYFPSKLCSLYQDYVARGWTLFVDYTAAKDCGYGSVTYIKVYGPDEDIYEEYMLVNRQMERIGSTKVNLAAYATIPYVDDKVSELSSDINSTRSEAELARKYRNSIRSTNIVRVNSSSATHQFDVFVTRGEEAAVGSTITALGKNLLPCYKVNHTHKGVTFTSAENGYLVINGTSTDKILTSDPFFKNTFSVRLPQGRYRFTALVPNATQLTDGKLTGISDFGIYSETNSEVVIAPGFQKGESISRCYSEKVFELNSADTVWFGVDIPPNTTINNVKVQLQIGKDVGTDSKGFAWIDAYIPPTAYTIGMNGYVGVKSIGSVTTLISDTDGDSIQVAYNTPDYERDEYMQALIPNLSTNEVILVDEVTNIPYKLTMRNGKLIAEEVTE